MGARISTSLLVTSSLRLFERGFVSYHPALKAVALPVFGHDVSAFGLVAVDLQIGDTVHIEQALDLGWIAKHVLRELEDGIDVAQ